VKLPSAKLQIAKITNGLKIKEYKKMLFGRTEVNVVSVHAIIYLWKCPKMPT